MLSINNVLKSYFNWYKVSGRSKCHYDNSTSSVEYILALLGVIPVVVDVSILFVAAIVCDRAIWEPWDSIIRSCHVLLSQTA